ncbi:MAG: hypothetical protein LBG27_10635 [Spirochaetaceae bacterium]|jgi:hypothetical protein|nr:hypothetical protein [Spirochaetaceae bacterium]
MRIKRDLEQNVWYEVRTAVNVEEPLIQLSWTKVLFFRVLGETKEHYGFEMRGLKLENEQLSFYIKPTDGLQLPAIMQWLKQTFAVRLNVRTGRKGHVWGDRYWSLILEGRRLSKRWKLIGRPWKRKLKRLFRRQLPTCCLGTAPGRQG